MFVVGHVRDDLMREGQVESDLNLALASEFLQLRCLFQNTQI